MDISREKSARAHRRWWRAVRASKYRRASFDATTATVCSAPAATAPTPRSGLSAESQRRRTTLQKASGSQTGHVKRTASQGRVAMERHAIILRVHTRYTRASGLELTPPFSLASAAPRHCCPRLTDLFLLCVTQADDLADPTPRRLPIVAGLTDAPTSCPASWPGHARSQPASRACCPRRRPC